MNRVDCLGCHQSGKRVQVSSIAVRRNEAECWRWCFFLSFVFIWEEEGQGEARRGSEGTVMGVSICWFLPQIHTMAGAGGGGRVAIQVFHRSDRNQVIWPVTATSKNPHWEKSEIKNQSQFLNSGILMWDMDILTQGAMPAPGLCFIGYGRYV